MIVGNNNKKKKLLNCGLAVPADNRVKLRENEKINMYLDLARELKKTMKHKGDGDSNCNWCAQFSHRNWRIWK